MGSYLTRDAILQIDDLPVEDVSVPEWGGSVRVRGLTARERVEFEASNTVMRGDQLVPDVDNAVAKLVALCVVDEDGTQVFTRQDANALGEKSSAALARVFDVAARLSGMSQGTDVEIKKDSTPTLDAGSSFTSHGNSDAPSLNSSAGSQGTNSLNGKRTSGSRQRIS
jgi:hypothetical protein